MDGTLRLVLVPSPSVPSVLGKTARFSIRRELGRGEFASVYLAHDRERGEPVALKLIHRRSLRRVGIEQFRREFALSASIRHPNLARHHELFCEDGDWFFTMELVEGRDFVDHVRSDVDPGRSAHRHWTACSQPFRVQSSDTFHPCTIDGVRRLRSALCQLVSAVVALHDHGLVHRDLQPGNVRVTSEGRVVVLDYGLTTAVAPTPSDTSHGLVGMPEYMAPEQWERSAASPASDFYAVGVMLFEALTGGLPFAGQGEEIVLRKRTVTPPRPSHLVGRLPRDLDDLAARLLRIDPGQRPQGRDLLTELGV
jgi:serine/threonine protein kinase